MNNKTIYFILSFLVLGFYSSELKAQSSGSIDQSAEGEKPFSVLFNSQHHVGLGTGVDPYTQFVLGGAYKFSDVHEVSLIVPAKKLYTAPRYGVSELQFDDTYIYHLMTLSPDLFGFRLQWRSGFTLPTSYESIFGGIYSVPSGALIVSRDLIENKLKLSYQPYTRYYFKSKLTSSNGEPLPKVDLGNKMVATYFILPDLSFSLGASAETEWVEEVVRKSKPNEPNHYGKYGYEVSSAYQITKVLGLELGYGETDSFIDDGKYEVNVYDPEQARMYFGVNFKF